MAIALLSVSIAGASQAELAVQKTCPVMGGEIVTSVYSDYNDQRIYHCCGMCKTEFAKDPEKFLAKLEASGQKAFDLGAEREELSI